MKVYNIGILNNKSLDKIELENDKYKVSILTFGGIIQEYIYKPLNQNIVLGYDIIEKYINDTAYIGKMVAPTAGRIENAKYTLNNIVYELEQNEGENSLHSGSDSISFDVLEHKPIKNGVELSITKELNYNNILITIDIFIEYILEEDGLLVRNFVTTNKPLFINATNHTYFKLDNEKDILGHKLLINADKVYEIKPNKIANHIPIDVMNTNFDLRKEKELNEVIKKGVYQEMKNTLGLDNPFLLNKKLHNKEMELASILYSPKNNLELTILTTEDVVVCYSGNYLDETVPIDNMNPKYMGIALETQNHPNIINMDNGESYITLPSKPYYSSTKYILKERG